MKFVLTDKEIRKILQETLHKKADYKFIPPTLENTYFEVVMEDGMAEKENGELFSFVWEAED